MHEVNHSAGQSAIAGGAASRAGSIEAAPLMFDPQTLAQAVDEAGLAEAPVPHEQQLHLAAQAMTLVAQALASDTDDQFLAHAQESMQALPEDTDAPEHEFFRSLILHTRDKALAAIGNAGTQGQGVMVRETLHRRLHALDAAGLEA